MGGSGRFLCVTAKESWRILCLRMRLASGDANQAREHRDSQQARGKKLHTILQ